MGRQRSHVAGGIYHVTDRGNDRQTLYRDEPDYVAFERMLAKVCARFDWSCHAYCLMPNHYHLVLETPEPNLAAGMHVLNLSYARWFNWRHRCVGHVFESPYRDNPIADERHLLATYRYVALNPVRARLCRLPEDWPWTSYRATAGAEPAPPFLRVDRVRRFFTPVDGDPTAGFAAFVHAGIAPLGLAAAAGSARG